MAKRILLPDPEFLVASIEEVEQTYFVSQERERGDFVDDEAIFDLTGRIEKIAVAPGLTHSPLGVDPMGSHTIGRDSHDEPGRHRCNSDRSPLVVARRDACGAMARLID